MRIYKYQLGTIVIIEEEIKVDMPVGARVLHVQSQKDIPYVWALVDPSAELKEHYFYIAFTGEDVPNEGEYLGTIFQFDGTYVWHVFEVQKPC